MKRSVHAARISAVLPTEESPITTCIPMQPGLQAIPGRHSKVKPFLCTHDVDG